MVSKDEINQMIRTLQRRYYRRERLPDGRRMTIVHLGRWTRFIKAEHAA